MPSFADSLGNAERWALAYYVLSLSAWADPLTGEKLQLSDAAKAALNSRGVEASHPRRAWDPALDGPGVAEAAGTAGPPTRDGRE